jgi:predicted Rossmann fold nucleotide-binding protein DprA/Smf involved in DNA uptake
MDHCQAGTEQNGKALVYQSFGPNSLIDPGAKLVQSRRDVVDELPPDLGMLSEEEARILELLKMDEATQFDKILRSSGAGVSRMNVWTRQLPGNMQVRIKTRKDGP